MYGRSRRMRARVNLQYALICLFPAETPMSDFEWPRHQNELPMFLIILVGKPEQALALASS